MFHKSKEILKNFILIFLYFSSYFLTAVAYLIKRKDFKKVSLFRINFCILTYDVFYIQMKRLTCHVRTCKSQISVSCRDGLQRNLLRLQLTYIIRTVL